MEHGIHCIDLFRWFIGEFNEVAAFVETEYWKIRPLEDNAFVLFRSPAGTVASLHSSLTQWKNLFSFEVFGDEGYATIDGLGGAYGTECLTTGRVEFDKPFQSETTEFRGADISWAAEWMEFRSAVAEKRNPIGDGRDGVQAMRLALAAYEASNKRSIVKLQ